VLLELYRLEEEEEVFDPPALRGPGPLIRGGLRLPGCRLPRGCSLGMGPALLRPSAWVQAIL
jgi:hypothetical protein